MPRLLLLIIAFALMANVAYQDETPEPEATSDVRATPEVEATAEVTPEAPVFPEPGSYTARETYGDLQRSYRIYIPEAYAEQDEPTALILVFHGAGGNGQFIESFSGFNALSEEMGFVAVYPDGINGAWNDGRVGDPRVGQIDDMPFVLDIITYLTENLNIDRVYATGYSMGGMFSFRLGCEMRDQIAGVASVASTFPEYLLGACQGTPPVPVIVIQGTDDPIVPWRGASGGYLSAADTVAYWSLHNQCDTYNGITLDDDVDPDDNTRVLRESFTGCEDSADVMLYGIFYGGHTWPGGPIRAPFELGATSGDIDAARVIWEFFNSISS